MLSIHSYMQSRDHKGAVLGQPPSGYRWNGKIERPTELCNGRITPEDMLGVGGRSMPGKIAYFFESTAARNRSSDSTSAGSATVSAIS